MSCVYHGGTNGEGCGYVNRFKPHPHPIPVKFLQTLPKRCFCYCMSLHVCSGDLFFTLDSRSVNFFKTKMSFWLSACNGLIEVSLHCAFFFPFDVLDGRCNVIVSIVDHCFPLYLIFKITDFDIFAIYLSQKCIRGF